MNDSKLLIPRFLFEPEKKVRSRWRKMLRGMAATGTWKADFTEAELVPISEAPYMLVLHGPIIEPDVTDHVLLYPIVDGMCDWVCEDRDARWSLALDLTVAGLQEFWFALATLGGGPRLLPMADPARERHAARLLLPLLFRWWDEFILLQDRFFTNGILPTVWPRWGSRALILTREAGFPPKELSELSPEAYRAETMKLLQA